MGVEDSEIWPAYVRAVSAALQPRQQAIAIVQSQVTRPPTDSRDGRSAEVGQLVSRGCKLPKAVFRKLTCSNLVFEKAFLSGYRSDLGTCSTSLAFIKSWNVQLKLGRHRDNAADELGLQVCTTRGNPKTTPQDPSQSDLRGDLEPPKCELRSCSGSFCPRLSATNSSASP